MTGMIPAPTFCACPPREGAGRRTETWEHARTCPVRNPLDPMMRCATCGAANGFACDCGKGGPR
jgi:hypothetical protein